MFGHLKADQFINMLEGLGTTEERLNLQRHLDACPRCAETLQSMRGLHLAVQDTAAETDDFIPEPDWSDFREGVRDTLLSRAVKRNTRLSWPVWATSSWRPALAWGMSAIFVVALATGMLVWNREAARTETAATIDTLDVDDTFIEADFDGPTLIDLGQWVETDVLQQVADLDQEEAANLQLLLREAVAELQGEIK